MSNYTKSTNFASKDSLSTGNPLKIVKGTEIDTEFNNIATAVATKADLNSPALIGTPTAPTASSGTNTTQVATTAFVGTAVTNERTASATLTNKTLTSPYVNEILFEGTDDAHETKLAFTDPTADRTITFPDSSGTVAFTSDVSVATTTATIVASSGSYAIAGSSSLTVTATAHGRAEGDVVYLNFTSGTAVANNFTIATVPTANTFTVNYGSSLTTSGNVDVYYSSLGRTKLASAAETAVGLSTTSAATPAGVEAHMNATAFGAGQTWQTVTRTSNTWYQNTTGRPIMVFAQYNSFESGVTFSVNPSSASSSGATSISFSDGDGGDSGDYGIIVVPSEHYYTCNNWGTSKELR